MYRWSNAGNFGSVRLMAREKILAHRQTDRRTDTHGEYIKRLFSDEKSADNNKFEIRRKLLNIE